MSRRIFWVTVHNNSDQDIRNVRAEVASIRLWTIVVHPQIETTQMSYLRSSRPDLLLGANADRRSCVNCVRRFFGDLRHEATWTRCAARNCVGLRYPSAWCGRPVLYQMSQARRRCCASAKLSKLMLPDTFLLETAEEAFDDAILLGRIRRDEFLGQPIIAARRPEPATLKDQPIVTANDRHGALWAQCPESMQARGFQGPFRLFGSAAQGELIANDFAIMAINHRGQMRPAIGATAEYASHPSPIVDCWRRFGCASPALSAVGCTGADAPATRSVSGSDRPPCDSPGGPLDVGARPRAADSQTSDAG